MAKLMWICGILLVAAGLALGIVAFVATVPPGAAVIVSDGLTPRLAVIAAPSTTCSPG